VLLLTQLRWNKYYYYYLNHQNFKKHCGLKNNHCLTCGVCLFLAFAELQIDMSEVTNDILSSSGLPFRDYKSYCARVLFASDKWHCYVKVKVTFNR